MKIGKEWKEEKGLCCTLPSEARLCHPEARLASQSHHLPSLSHCTSLPSSPTILRRPLAATSPVSTLPPRAAKPNSLATAEITQGSGFVRPAKLFCPRSVPRCRTSAQYRRRTGQRRPSPRRTLGSPQPTDSFVPPSRVVHRAISGEESVMEEGKIDSNEIKDKNDHVDHDPSPYSVNEVKLPEIGMTFSSEEEVRIFYNSYAQNVGSGIYKLGGRNGDDGKQKYFSIGCAKNGSKVSQAKNVLYPQPSTKTNCKAKINVAIRNDQNFVITSVGLNHNHILSPGKS
ncbi:hypothetical protein ZIOFF_013831 [Zingiber officinale]|uniref:FAR1 domain-containing protein n=1 Tax=Zingiber officinale TaxID=94328 RepID=A0A8J5HC72_ZINOF|nr:hypothetical protein ZIOFF_013831 [Zingiber officinale]